MTKKSVREYAAAIRNRYCRVNKEQKKKILDEFVKVTGYDMVRGRSFLILKLQK